MKEKSIHLMTAVVRYFDSALIYYNRNFFGNSPFSLKLMAGNLLRTIGDGTNVYDEGKQQLYLAIQEYDQAVFDLTVIVVAGSVQFNKTC